MQILQPQCSLFKIRAHSQKTIQNLYLILRFPQYPAVKLPHFVNTHSLRQNLSPRARNNCSKIHHNAPPTSIKFRLNRGEYRNWVFCTSQRVNCLIANKNKNRAFIVGVGSTSLQLPVKSKGFIYFKKYIFAWDVREIYAIYVFMVLFRKTYLRSFYDDHNLFVL